MTKLFIKIITLVNFFYFLVCQNILSSELCTKNLQVQISSVEDTSLEFVKILILENNPKYYLTLDCQSFLHNISLFNINTLEDNSHNLSSPLCKPLYISEDYCLKLWEKIQISLEKNIKPEIHFIFDAQKIKFIGGTKNENH